MLNGTQITLQEVDDDYRAFVDKFKPKKTTDDCYTPDNVYKAVLDWVVNEYGIAAEDAVRPFWPGGDYERYEYPPDCVVVDNPPFSIIAEIVNNYNAAGIKYFLFAPYLTNFTAREKTSHIITGTNITYEIDAKSDVIPGYYEIREITVEFANGDVKTFAGNTVTGDDAAAIRDGKAVSVCVKIAIR